MTSLNYASLKDAFSPLEGVRKRRAEEGHDPAAAEGTARAARRQHYYDEGPPHPPAPPHPRRRPTPRRRRTRGRFCRNSP